MLGDIGGLPSITFNLRTLSYSETVEIEHTIIYIECCLIASLVQLIQRIYLICRVTVKVYKKYEEFRKNNSDVHVL